MRENVEHAAKWCAVREKHAAPSTVHQCGNRTDGTTNVTERTKWAVWLDSIFAQPKWIYWCNGESINYI